MGGSFNPAHGGHLHISRQALARLGLDQVWWLVSPQNPLKPARGMAPLAERVAAARALACHPRIVVSDIEAELGTRYTVDTVAALRRRYPRTRFVWIMGADILIEIPRWKDWPRLFASLPVAIFDRPSYASRALAGVAAQRFGRFRRPEAAAIRLAEEAPPAWLFLHTPVNLASATAIRARRGV